MKHSQTLIEGIQGLLESAEKPLSEYELIRHLKEQGWALSTDSTKPLDLFTSHFLVFNALYRLQVQYWDKERRYLGISALSIQLNLPIEQVEGGSDLQAYNGDNDLRDYYLDFSHLEEADNDSVNALLNQFWEYFIATDDRSEALSIFSLEHPVTREVIKQRYRYLAMEHHPDRGGESEQFQRINWAFGILQRAYTD